MRLPFMVCKCLSAYKFVWRQLGVRVFRCADSGWRTFCLKGDFMGIITTIISIAAGASVLTAHAALAAKKKGDKERKKKFEALETEWKETEKTYKIRREALVDRKNRGDKKAARQLEELDYEHEMKKAEYEVERGKLVPDYVDKKLKEDGAKKKSIDVHDDCEDTETDSEVLSCTTCGMNIPKDAKFCSFCGSKVPVSSKSFCSTCGAEVSSDAVFCHKCGNKL